ncbi:hypothetical protein MKW94_027610 [Papaver nudicaule]|uniref:Glabrous enhancer-binding protein-like DBD domain-containing protein n=1 Tax=Papaver nudicaule TaxID=74823 RepID=A0AA42AQ61_PAPNU|nr:hypothetical protein [Papaver nudicaule]
MAPKKTLLQDPPPASSSDEELESGEEEEEEEEVESGEEEEEEAGGEGQEEEDEEESESDEEELTQNKPEAVETKPESSSEEDDEEEDSDEEGSESDEIPAKSVPEEPKPQKKTTVSKPSSSAPAIAVAPVSSKRPAEIEQAEEDSKKKKKRTHDENGEKVDPKKLFARVWSDGDEVAILEGMLKWHERGADPFADLGGFLDSIKENLHVAVPVKTDQLLNKMRRLKKKYQNNFKRGKGGLDPIFSKPHDLQCYELMKVIWGGEEVSSRKRSAPVDNGNEESGATSNGGKKSRSSKTKTTAPVSPKQKTVALSDLSKELPKEVQEGEMVSYPLLAAAFLDKKNSTTVGESLLKEGLALLGDSKVREMENKWRQLHQEEAEVYLKRCDLVRELTAAVLNAVKSSDAA